MSILSVEDISKSYKLRKVVKGISLEINSGEVVGLFGLLGAGCIDAALAIYGAYRGRREGQIIVEGAEVSIERPEDAVSLGLGLMAKPVLVTLPLVLLLLDYWPLRRDEQGEGKSWVAGWRGRVVEKLPLFGVAAACAALAVWADQGAGSHQEGLTVGYRLSTALIAYASYLQLTLWPWDLAAFYPHWGAALPIWKVVASGVLIASVTVAVLRYGRAHRYLVVGWFWFLGVIVIVSRLFQGVGQAMADRYTYVSLVGLSIRMVWG
ncbi:MAG: hypothetical protein IIB77_14155, partial [Proteobacteria bacterium]|nr:hypothetical protein [Pseudomonadota bacterium]